MELNKQNPSKYFFLIFKLFFLKFPEARKSDLRNATTATPASPVDPANLQTHPATHHPPMTLTATTKSVIVARKPRKTRCVKDSDLRLFLQKISFFHFLFSQKKRKFFCY